MNDDVCDMCLRSDVEIARTTYCGETICVDCDEDSDGTCGDVECEPCVNGLALDEEEQ